MKHFRLLLTIFIFWLLAFIMQKPLFMLGHLLEHPASGADFLHVMLHGSILDVTVASYCTAIPLLLMILHIWWKKFPLQKILQLYTIIILFIVATLTSIDMALYSYWGFRLDATFLFYLKSPKDAIASIPWLSFIGHFTFFLSYFFAFIWIYKKGVRTIPTPAFIGNKSKETLFILIFGGFLFIGIRGGVTTSTANVGKVYFSNQQYLNHAAINPCFSFLASVSKQQNFSQQFNFYKENERKQIYDTLHQETDPTLTPEVLKITRPNILLFVLESFSANTIEALGGTPQVTPSLNALMKEGIAFTSLYANSFRTDRGLVAVLNGYLAQPTTSIMKYPSKSQTLPSIAKSLSAIGYHNDLLYGGDINFTNMKSYFFSSGYQKITADVDFPLSERLNKWGVNDNYTFNRLYEMIQERKKATTPWMTTFLTLSSHEPFKVPFHRLKNPYLNSVAFTDSCLGNFIQKIKKTPAWDNLLIIMIADHGFKYPANLNQYEPRRYHIPMLWIGGAIKKPMRVNRIGNQTDLSKTLLRQLKLPTKAFSFSKDLFHPNSPEYAFYTNYNLFGFIDSTGVSAYDNDGKHILLQGEERLKKGKAILQTLYDDLGAR